LESEEALLKVYQKLEENEIYTRRYFYPALDTLDYVNKGSTPVCDDIASRVLCLPIYFNMLGKDIDCVCDVILKEISN
jgi:dTDP-4-amino-4,6-dideoxygalactose transaminase